MNQNLKKILPYAVAVVVVLFVSGILPLSASSRISYDELSELIVSGEDYILLDVRTNQEYQSGHIPTAQLIPYDRLPAGMENIEKDALIIVYCRSGNRSSTAYKTLEKAGFTNLKDFGGISGWKGKLE